MAWTDPANEPPPDSLNPDGERYSTPYPEGLFDWQRVLFTEGARGTLSGREVAIAGMVALSGDNTTGRNCRLQEKRLVAEFGIHRSTLHRTFTKLRKAGWFEQTKKPVRVAPGQGEMARYRVAWPRLELRHDTEPDRVASSAESVRHGEADAASTVSQVEAHRVANQASPCRTGTPDVETPPTSYGPTSDEPTYPDAHSSASTTGQARAACADFITDPFDHDPDRCCCGVSRVEHELADLTPDSAGDRDVAFDAAERARRHADARRAASE
jgi:hypothetical protein